MKTRRSDGLEKLNTAHLWQADERLLFDDKANCLFDSRSVITLNMHWGLLFICRVSLTSSLLSPSLRGYCSCLWSWLWWLWFPNARQFIDLPRVNLPGWETICGRWHVLCVHLRTFGTHTHTHWIYISNQLHSAPRNISILLLVLHTL